MASIVDQWGQPFQNQKFLKASNNYAGNQPVEYVRPFDSLKKLVTYNDWLTTSFLSDKLYANFGIVEGAIAQKAMFAVGNAWKPVFLGLHKRWGAIAREWLIHQWYPACDVRGPNYDFVTNLFQQSVGVDRSGDSIEILLIGDDGWPLIQSIPCRQIGQWEQGWDVKVRGGEFDGANIVNGVIMDDYEQPIGYRKLGNMRGEVEEDIPACCVVHTFEPKWNEQARGFPIFSSTIEDFRMIARSEEWEQQAMLIASSIGLLEYNDTGEAPTEEEDVLGLKLDCDDQTPSGLQAKTLYGGLIRYLKSNSGKLEQFVQAKPGDEWEKFQDRQIRKALTGANWPYALVWKPDGTNGTVQRSELLKAKMSVKDRQALLYPRAKMKIQHAICAAIEMGEIPPYPGTDKGGHLRWGFTLPKQISIDEGKDRANRREDNKLGFINDSTVIEEEAETTYEEHMRQRWHDVAIREITRREAEVKYGVKLDPREGKMLGVNDQATGDDEEEDDDRKDNQDENQ